jgi:hypothetical protein
MSENHPEKIDHAVDRLTAAGLASGSDDSPSSSSSSGSDNKYIIIGSVVGGVVLLALVGLAFFFWRRYRKRKAYTMVHRGADMAQGPANQGMSGGLTPVSCPNCLLPMFTRPDTDLLAS